MAEQFEFFLEPEEDGSTHPPQSLWRRAGDQWEFYSLITWSWQPLPAEGPPWVPRADWLRRISAEEATELTADRQRWVRYWALYPASPSGRQDRPRTVVRRRDSPERRLDESFARSDRWEPTTAIAESYLPQASNPRPLVAIDPDAAERILREVCGVADATQL